MENSNRFLRAAAEAHRRLCKSDVMGCIFELALREGDFEAAHEIAARYEELISDELVRKWAGAALAAMAEARKAERSRRK